MKPKWVIWWLITETTYRSWQNESVMKARFQHIQMFLVQIEPHIDSKNQVNYWLTIWSNSFNQVMSIGVFAFPTVNRTTTMMTTNLPIAKHKTLFCKPLATNHHQKQNHFFCIEQKHWAAYQTFCLLRIETISANRGRFAGLLFQHLCISDLRTWGQSSGITGLNPHVAIPTAAWTGE